MSKQFKIVLIIFCIVAVTSAIVYNVIPDYSEDKDETKEETKKIKYTKSQIPKGIGIGNEEVTINGEDVSYKALIFNETKKPIYVKEIYVIIRDNNKDTIAEFTIGLDTKLSPQKSIEVSSQGTTTNTNEYKDIIYVFKPSK